MSGPFQGRRIEANPGETVSVGRTTKADVVLEDNFLSSAHFAIVCDLGSCRVRDLKSRNGTHLNGEIIIEASLNEGDQVHAGKTDFIVRIEDQLKTKNVSAAELAAVRSELALPGALSGTPPSPPARKKAPPPAPVSESLPKRAISEEPSISPQDLSSPPAPKVVEPPRVPEPRPRVIENAPPPDRERRPETLSEPPPIPSATSQADFKLPTALDTYEAATPDGRLQHILSSQPGTLMALIDGVHDPQVFELLRGTSEEYRSLYRNDLNAAVAPYLVRLPPRSDLLKQMVQKGWGREWGVYLTCPLSLSELREFFRSTLMVTMPDGMELFSRFYDPRFFRAFLEKCSAAEAEKFFGPITSYFMEDERPEILLQFRRSRKGAEKKGHLLSVLS
jgi:pSer/pThr/pTyr-binding forkhead associated (FHA) protein